MTEFSREILIELLGMECPIKISGHLHTHPHWQYRHYRLPGETDIRCQCMTNNPELPEGRILTDAQAYLEAISPPMESVRDGIGRIADNATHANHVPNRKDRVLH